MSPEDINVKKAQFLRRMAEERMRVAQTHLEAALEDLREAKAIEHVCLVQAGRAAVSRERRAAGN